MVVTQPITLWKPSEFLLRESAMARFLQRASEQDEQISDYPSLHQWSVDESDAFWKLWLEESKILHQGDPSPTRNTEAATLGAHFFPNVTLNFAENLLRHQNDSPAIHG